MKTTNYALAAQLQERCYARDERLDWTLGTTLDALQAARWPEDLRTRESWRRVRKRVFSQADLLVLLDDLDNLEQAT